jgi:hypothetical protein
MAHRSSTLKDTYNEVIKYGNFVRSNRLNGLIMWNVLKVVFQQIFGDRTYEWNTSHDQIIGEYNLLDGKFIGHLEPSDSLDKLRWEPEHFLVQHIRILKETKKPTIVKILQVAYNTGQLEAEMNKNREFYKQFKNNVVSYPSEDSPLKIKHLKKINRYISPEMQDTDISELVPDSTPAIAISHINKMLAPLSHGLPKPLDESTQDNMMGGSTNNKIIRIDFTNIKYI